jgi:tetratricopeptide (TPR) repeat protein
MTISNTGAPAPRRRGARRPRGLPALILAAGLAAVAAGCDFLDPTDVENPRTTAEDLAQAAEPVRALLPGARAQFARMLSAQVVISEVVSDNYAIHGTGLDSQYDEPRGITPDLVNFTSAAQGIYWNTQELRALTDFILDDIAPGDATATPAQLAELRYYRAMAYLFQGENFTHAPTERDGAARPASELLERAVAEFEASLSASGSGAFALPARAGLARAHRLLGNAGGATQAAQQALAGDPFLLFQQEYDATSITNGPNNFLVIRAIKEMQPLPRLDFLDPKYIRRESPIAVAKAEEMHLILAEAALAAGSLEAGKAHLADAIRLAGQRAVEVWADDDQRLNDDLTPRPRSAEILVRADPDSPFRAGLVLDRPGVENPVPVVSATSLDADSVQALTGADEIWHAFHLARQEIMFLEGRRMSDLGIRLPMMRREIDVNPSISMGSPGTTVVVPDYIPPLNQMDLFDPSSPYTQQGNDWILNTTEVTIRFDLNRILTQNRVSPFLN